MENYKIFWYRAIPYVIAETRNPEWGKLWELKKEKGISFSELEKIYNSNGNWYILEGLDYFWFRLSILTRKGKDFLYNDSMHIGYNGKSDKEKYAMLQKQAKADIDGFWNDIYSIFKREKNK